MLHRYLPLVLFLAGCASSSSMVPAHNTREDVAGYVNRAAAVVAQHGPSCETFKQPDWMSGDWYIFVVGPDDRIICHPTTSLVGRMNNEVVDANGKNIGNAITAAANAPAGHGWVDYVWPRPGQTTPVPKSTYAVRVIGPDGKQYIVGSGGYELK